MFTFDDIDFSSRDRLTQGGFDRCHRRRAASVNFDRAGRLASKSAPATPMTLTVAPDNFSRRHHVLMIAGPVADGRGERFASEAATANPTQSPCGGLRHAQ